MKGILVTVDEDRQVEHVIETVGVVAQGLKPGKTEWSVVLPTT